MLFGLSFAELALFAVAILAAGALSGLLAGLFGIGGSSIVIPVLYEFFRIFGVDESVRMQLCIGTALAITVPTLMRAYYEHRARGAILEGAMRIWAVPSMLGVAAGSYVAYIAPGAVFKTTFMIFAVVMALRFLFGRDGWQISDRLPGRPAMLAAGATFGLLATLVGVAGGSFSTFFLTLYGQPFHKAVATSSGIGAMIGVAATVGYMIAGWQYQALMPPLTLGFVSVLGFLAFTPASVLAAPYGARLAHRLPKRRLETAFGIFLLLVAARFGASLLV